MENINEIILKFALEHTTEDVERALKDAHELKRFLLDGSPCTSTITWYPSTTTVNNKDDRECCDCDEESTPKIADIIRDTVEKKSPFKDKLQREYEIHHLISEYIKSELKKSLISACEKIDKNLGIDVNDYIVAKEPLAEVYNYGIGLEPDPNYEHPPEQTEHRIGVAPLPLLEPENRYYNEHFQKCKQKYEQKPVGSESELDEKIISDVKCLVNHNNPISVDYPSILSVTAKAAPPVPSWGEIQARIKRIQDNDI